MTLLRLLSVGALIGSGTVAGVLFAVALSTVPALAGMTPGRYVYVHTMLGRNWDPTMPIIVLTSTALTIALAVLAPGPAARALAVAGAICLFGVSVVSHLRNVPINRIVHATDPEAIPAGWSDPRPRWRQWHLLRTGLALAALAVNSVAVTLMP
jgi:uncharacterized membrane protein